MTRSCSHGLHDTNGMASDAQTDVAAALKLAAFVPTAAGGPAAPGSLCDPRCAELTALMDPAGRHFPGGPFGQSEQVLTACQQPQLCHQICGWL